MPTSRLRERSPVVGEDEVAHAREPHEGLRLAAERDPEANDFRQPARDERGARIAAEFEAVGDARGDRDHVLHRAAQHHAHHVRARVQAQPRRVERGGRRRGESGLPGSDHEGGGQSLRDFEREARPRHRAHARGARGSVSATISCGMRRVADSKPLQAQSSAGRALTSATDSSVGRSPAAEVATMTSSTSASAARRSGSTPTRAGSGSLREIRARAPPRERLARGRIARPQAHLVCGAQRDRERRSPGSRAEDRDPHRLRRPTPATGGCSPPARRGGAP